jgi:cyclohexadienyl dehydratase
MSQSRRQLIAEPSQQEFIVEEQNSKFKIAAKLKQLGYTVSTLLLAGAMMFPLSAPIEAQAAGSISPGSRLDEIRARGTLRVGMPGDYLPFGLCDKATGQWKGLDVDEAIMMAKALNVKLEIVHTSWSTLTSDLLAGKFDVGAGGVSITPERQKVAFFSTAILEDGKTPITRCENTAKFSTLADIDKPGVRVITPLGGTNEGFDRTHLHVASIIVFPDNTRIFDEVIAGRADLMITDAIETKLQHRIHPELCSVHPDHPFTFAQKAYLLPRDSGWKQWVDEFLLAQMKTGSFNEALRHWLN